MSFLQRIFGKDRRSRLGPLYLAVVARGRDPAWYREGGVPDTLDGRFDMMAAIMAIVLLRLEREGEAGREPSVLLTEIFIDDMDSSLRQIGIGEYVVGKHVGRLMGALGGRLGSLREVLAKGEPFDAFVHRNIFHENPVEPEALQFVARGLENFAASLEEAGLTDLVAGRLEAR